MLATKYTSAREGTRAGATRRRREACMTDRGSGTRGTPNAQRPTPKFVVSLYKGLGSSSHSRQCPGRWCLWGAPPGLCRLVASVRKRAQSGTAQMMLLVAMLLRACGV